jgi:hypothetical protein
MSFNKSFRGIRLNHFTARPLEGISARRNNVNVVAFKTSSFQAANSTESKLVVKCDLSKK